MKEVRHFTGIVIVVLLCICLYACLKPAHVDVVMIGNDVTFVLEDEQEISAIQVTAFEPNKENPRGKTMWAGRHDLTTEVSKRKYPRLKQIKYGQAIDELPQVAGPIPLKRNVEYWVGIDMGDRFARGVFIMTDDNKVVMPRRKVKDKSAE